MTTAALKLGKSGSYSWTLRLFTLLIWLLVGLCAAYWAFKFVTTKPLEATAALAAPTVVVDSKAVGKLLGATDNLAVKAINTPANSNFALFGLARSAGGQGVALIALDGKPAKPYRVGSTVADNLVLKSISKTGIILAASLQAPDGVTLELPDRKPASLVAVNNFANNRGTALVAPPAAPPVVSPVPVPTTALGISPSAVPVLGGAASAAISRFAPRVASVDGAAPAMPPAIPPAATSAAGFER